jgi:hypothetical protein
MAKNKNPNSKHDHITIPQSTLKHFIPQGGYKFSFLDLDSLMIFEKGASQYHKEFNYYPQGFDKICQSLETWLGNLRTKIMEYETNGFIIGYDVNLLTENVKRLIALQSVREPETLNSVMDEVWWEEALNVNEAFYARHGIGGHSLKPYDAALENLWKSLPNLVQGDNKTIVVADGSGSMMSTIGRTNIWVLTVANALAVYFAEKLSGEFKNKYITFSARPQLVDFSKCSNLKEKIELAYRHNEVANTNIEAVFNLILISAQRVQMKQEDLPANILILSDMEFDRAIDGKINQK